MKINWRYMVVVLALLWGSTACATNNNQADMPEIRGPALVLFYTDN